MKEGCIYLFPPLEGHIVMFGLLVGREREREKSHEIAFPLRPKNVFLQSIGEMYKRFLSRYLGVAVAWFLNTMSLLELASHPRKTSLGA